MLEKWKKNLDRKGKAAALLTDLSKAFDCLNHELLIAKLDAYGFSHSALTLIYSYLRNRWQRTKVNNSFSSWSCINTGVAQGGVLGPLLFNIYENDIFYFINEEELTNYADDNTPYVVAKTLKDVIELLDKNVLLLSRWLKDNYFVINANKCHLLVPKHSKDVAIKIGGEIVKCEAKVILLGITIDTNLDFDDHVASFCKKASQKLHALARIAPFMETNKLRIIMKAFIESQFSYCPLTWMFHSRKLNNRINRIHKRALNIVYKDPTSSFEDLLKRDKSFTIHERNLQRLATEIYKTKNNLAPSFMKKVFPDSQNHVNLRNKPEIQTQNVKSVYMGSETVSFRGPRIWAMVPDRIKSASSLSDFKIEIKAWKPVGCTCRLCKTYVKNLGFIN